MDFGGVVGTILDTEIAREIGRATEETLVMGGSVMNKEIKHDDGTELSPRTPRFLSDEVSVFLMNMKKR